MGFLMWAILFVVVGLLAMLIGAKANALLDGRVHVSSEDIRYVAYPVMRHRLVTSFAAESDGVTTDNIVEKLIDVVREE